MKDFLLLGFLFVLLFFACSNEGLDIKEPEKRFCFLAEQNKCYDISPDICADIGGEERKSCPQPPESSSSNGGNGSSSSEGTTDGSSSSGEDGSSSSVGGDGSSSSGGSSSSSSGLPPVPDPVIAGSLSFVSFSYSSSGTEVYFIGTDITDKINNELAITNSEQAQCGTISIEVTGNGLTGTPGIVTAPGTITATAKVTCNETEMELDSKTATVVPNPTFSDCALPSTYVYRGEPITDLVSINDNYDRCANVSYSPAIYPSSSSGELTLSIAATVLCQGAGVTVSPKSCQVSVFVADRYLKFSNIETDYNMSSGSTAIELPVNNNLPNKIGCNGGIHEDEQGLIRYRINRRTTVVEGNYWAETNFEPDDYLTNGNRILLETIKGEIRTCKTMAP